jgi:hypothetical protein
VDLRDEGTAHDSIRDADIKFGVAVDAGYVLTFFLGGSMLHGHMDILSDCRQIVTGIEALLRHETFFCRN